MEALGLRRSLQAVQAAFMEGIRSGTELSGVIREELSPYPRLQLQYGEIVHPESLDPLEAVTPGAVAVLAAHCGRTRLIDNHILEA